MFGLAKKGLFIGLGVASLTKDKIEKFVGEFSRRAKLNEEEGKKLAEYLQTESVKAKDSLKGMVDCMVQAGLQKMPIYKDMEIMKSRVAQLEARVAALSKDDTEQVSVEGDV